jgi:hypothetical protein
MAITGSIDQVSKRLMLENLADGDGTSHGPIIKIRAYNGSNLVAEYTTTTVGNSIFDYNTTTNLLSLISGETYSISIPSATTIDKVTLGARILTAPEEEYRNVVTLNLGAEAVTFQGPGTYTITQFDINLT